MCVCVCVCVCVCACGGGCECSRIQMLNRTAGFKLLVNRYQITGIIYIHIRERCGE